MIIPFSKGVRFEDNNVLLKWGETLETLCKNTHSQKEIQSDRTIYHWGTHSILNGLQLEFASMHWNHEIRPVLSSIEYWAVGDDIAKESFELISKHLLKELGLPAKKEETDETDKSWQWSLDEVTITLYLFEQHCYKLSFNIRKKKPVKL